MAGMRLYLPAPTRAGDLSGAGKSSRGKGCGNRPQDYPNQVNNVLVFLAFFRGTFDVRARDINDDMKIAAAKPLPV